MEILLNNNNYKSEVEESTKPVIIDIFADWCPPCQMMAPHFEELAREYSDKYKFAKLNVDEAREISISLGISSIPTLVFIKGGKILGRSVGYKSKDEIEDMIKKFFA